MAVGLFATLSAVCQAQIAPPFAQLLGDALVRAPTLIEQRATVNAAGADAAQAKAWLNPRIDVLSENLGAPAPGGISQRQDTMAVTQPFEIGGKRGARIEASERNLAASEARAQQVRVNFAAELAMAYATAEAALARKVLAAEDVARARDDLRATQALVNAGREADLRLAQVRASFAVAQAAEQAAASDAVAALERLSALTGMTVPYVDVTGGLLALPGRAVPTAEGTDSPAVVTARREQEALEAQVLVEQKRWIPDVGVSAGVRRYGWTNATGYQVGVSLSVPLFDRNTRAVEAAQQRASAAEARLIDAQLQAGAAGRSARAQVAAAGQRLVAADTAEQAAAEAYRLGRIGYEAGRTSLIELLATRRALVEARALTIEARLTQVRAAAALAVAGGQLAFSGE